MQRPLPAADEVERALAAVYARPELAAAEPTLLARAAARAWVWLRELLARAVPDLASGAEAARLVFWVVAAALALVGAALAARLLRDALGAWRRRARRRPPAAPAAAAGEVDWAARADAAALAGRLREATLALYQALLARLEARGALRRAPAKTPGDYRRETRADEAAARLLRTFLAGFEPVAFGARPIDDAGYERLRALVGEAGPRA